MFVNYAHRGASAYAPEGTISAFDLGISMGADGIELDLQGTKDGKIVIFHDDKIDNKSNGSGRIADYTYEELSRLDFGGWFDIRYKGEKIVLFEDFAKTYLSKNLTFAIELKVQGIEKETLAIIDKYKTHNKIYITSFNYDILTAVRREDKDIKTGWLVQSINKESIDGLLEISGNQICPNAEKTSDEDVALARSFGLEVRLWGVKDEEVMGRAFKLDTDGMTVNFPDKLKSLRDKSGK